MFLSSEPLPDDFLKFSFTATWSAMVPSFCVEFHGCWSNNPQVVYEEYDNKETIGGDVLELFPMKQIPFSQNYSRYFIIQNLFFTPKI